MASEGYHEPIELLDGGEALLHMADGAKVPCSRRQLPLLRQALGNSRNIPALNLLGEVGVERALELLIRRGLSRVAFGKKLSDQGSIRQDVA